MSKKDRVYVGSKGIGRFSADRLGAKLKITTKTQTEKSQHELLIDWEKFDQNLKSLFEEISIDYNEIYALNNELNAFTQIDIFELHENWSHDDISKVKESLRRLKNPFVDDDGFKILFIDSTDLLEVKEYIKSNIAEVLKDKSITVEAKFEKNINVKLFDRGEKIYEIEADNTTVLRTCPIKVNVNYLTISAKSAFTKKMKVEPVNYGNIFIYKNNFRVLPYGDTDYDLFGLNMRKTQGHSRYLGTREIIGFVEIYDKNNSFLKKPLQEIQDL
ncbi:ATP-binding protein [Acinetobacter johnsonii]|nr:ATP-binding protein [Acinetobacter johnsonii]